MPEAKSAWDVEEVAVISDKKKPEKECDVARWLLFCGSTTATLIPQFLEMAVIAKLYWEGDDYLVPSLMIFGLVYARVNSTYRAIAGFHEHTNKARACAYLAERPWLVVRSFLLKLDQIQEIYDTTFNGESKLQLVGLRLATLMSESTLLMYLKSYSLFQYWVSGSEFTDWGLMLASTLCTVASISYGMMDFELTMGAHSGYTFPSPCSWYAVCHMLTRTCELVGRCFGIAALAVFYPVPAVTSLVIITEECLIISLVLLYKPFVESPKFLSEMRSGRCGWLKVSMYMVVVMWPMYWCMHTQRYIESIPRPAFSYMRYYFVRLWFACFRTGLTIWGLMYDTEMDFAKATLLTMISVVATMVWTMAFYNIRAQSATIKSSKVEVIDGVSSIQ